MVVPYLDPKWSNLLWTCASGSFMHRTALLKGSLGAVVKAAAFMTRRAQIQVIKTVSCKKLQGKAAYIDPSGPTLIRIRASRNFMHRAALFYA
jgi:hypothetical protein